VLARGDIQCIGTTTVEEYRTHIEKDASLERRFQLIPVEQTSIPETVQILKGLAPKYQIHHKIEYSAEALLACVKLAAEHIPDRSMPDKAIDVFDEVGAFVRLRNQSSKAKVSESGPAKEARRKLLEVQQQKAMSVQDEQYNVAAKLKIIELRLQAALEEILSGARSDVEVPDVQPIVVIEDDVAHVVSRMTGVPVEKLSNDESVRMQNLEEMLHKRIIGQDQAVVSVSKALRRARVGLKNPNRPIASFLFCGPTGVGKTELCKALSEFFFWQGGRHDPFGYE
jgi:ATP-dependent Clp protease ATP-binding subunit ClpC